MFVELEIVLKPGENVAHGVVIAETLMAKLQIEKDDLVPTAYVDLVSPVLNERKHLQTS